MPPEGEPFRRAAVARLKASRSRDRLKASRSRETVTTPTPARRRAGRHSRRSSCAPPYGLKPARSLHATGGRALQASRGRSAESLALQGSAESLALQGSAESLALQGSAESLALQGDGHDA